MLRRVEAASQVLALFTPDQPVWRLSSVAAAIGAPRTTTHATLAGLVSAGLLVQRARGTYQLSWRTLTLDAAAQAATDLPAITDRPLRHLCDTVGESVHLAVLDRWRVRSVSQAHFSRAVSVRLPTSDRRIPLLTSAIGRALLAARPDSDIRHYVIGSWSGASAIDHRSLFDDLAEVRDTGFALDDGQHAAEVACIARALPPELGAGPAVAVVMPRARFPGHRDMVLHALAETRARLIEAYNRDRPAAGAQS